MDIEIAAEAKDKALNQRVAITVVALSIFMGLGGVKDGNIGQSMQQAQSSAVDTWGEYQATKTKLHIEETALAQTRLLAQAHRGLDATVETVRLTAEIAKYQAEAPVLKAKAEARSSRMPTAIAEQ